MPLFPRPWWLKCAVQRVLSHLPGGYSLNSIWSRGARLHSFEKARARQGLRQVSEIRALGFDVGGKLACEIGPGWKPVIPYILRLAGCRHITLCDTTRHLTPKLLRVTARQIRAELGWLTRELDIPMERAERMLPRPSVQGFADLLGESGFEYRAPCDPCHLPLPEASLDLIISNAVLEHVPEAMLPLQFAEMRRLLRPDGLMVHYIDHRDHWHHFDSSIGPINFLKFPDWWWGVLNSPLAYQNRMRSAEFVALVRAAGFTVVRLEQVVDEQALHDASTLELDARYRSLAPEEVAVTSTLLVARPEGPSRIPRHE